MIVRTTHKRADDTDYGPCPGGVDGLGSANAMALRSEVFVAPVERRYLTPVELAVIRQSDPEPVKHVHVDRGVEHMREAGRRGAAATKRVKAQRRTEMGRPRLFTDEELYAALVSTRGSQVRAAGVLGVTRSGVRKRLRTLDGNIPTHVKALMRGPGGWWRWEKAA